MVNVHSSRKQGRAVRNYPKPRLKQATWAAAVLNRSSQTVPQLSLWKISKRPVLGSLPTNRTECSTETYRQPCI